MPFRHLKEGLKAVNFFLVVAQQFQCLHQGLFHHPEVLIQPFHRQRVR